MPLALLAEIISQTMLGADLQVSLLSCSNQPPSPINFIFQEHILSPRPSTRATLSQSSLHHATPGLFKGSLLSPTIILSPDSTSPIPTTIPSQVHPLQAATGKSYHAMARLKTFNSALHLHLQSKSLQHLKIFYVLGFISCTAINSQPLDLMNTHGD